MRSDALRARAFALHRDGRLSEAEQVYDEILRGDPDDFDVLHRQGVLAQETGRLVRAVELFGRSIALRPESAAVQASLAGALLSLGRYPQALAACDAALRLEPQQPRTLSMSATALRALHRPAEALARANAVLTLQPSPHAYCLQGGALRDLGRAAEALVSFELAITLDPQCVEAYNSRGILLQQLRHDADALASFEQALTLRPDSAELHNNRANMLRRLQRLPEALASCERAIALEPRFAPAYNSRGLVLQALHRGQEAAASFQRAVELQPGLAEAHNNLGTVQCELGQPAAALASCRRALELQPHIAGAHGNLANALRDLERPEEALVEADLAVGEDPSSAASHCHRGNARFDLLQLPAAIASYDRATELDRDYALAHFNKGLCLLLSGDFSRGLPLYEWRKRLPLYQAPASRAQAWLGEHDIAGSTLLVHADQALGDTLQGCRYVALAAERGVRVVLAAQPQLRELLSSLSPGLRLVAPGEQPPECDYQCALMSLPLAFGTTLATIPARIPYLSPQAARVARWGRQLGERGLRVGIAWQGSRSRIDVGRSVPLEMFARLARIPGVRLISLQKGAALAQLSAAASDWPIEVPEAPFDEGPQAFLDTAAIMANLDLVITSDTALAHLAGALGRPTWIALKQVPDWRWLLERADSPWYPSVRLFRQARRGDWQGVFAAIHGELSGLARAKA